MNKKLLFLLIILFSFGFTFSQSSNYYKCSNCANPLFQKSEILKEKKKNYIVKYNQSENPARHNEQVKDVHCAYCDSHTGYCEKEGEVKILPNGVHEESNNYTCGVCHKPLFNNKDLENKSTDGYTFKVVNNENIKIVNRSYIVHTKTVYCSFCYQELGKLKKKDLRLQKTKIVTP